MVLPNESEIGEHGLLGESSMQYIDIWKIEIWHGFKHGNLAFENDIEAIKKALGAIKGILMSESEEGICIEFE